MVKFGSSRSIFFPNTPTLEINIPTTTQQQHSVTPVRRRSLDTHSTLTVASMNVDADHVVTNMPPTSAPVVVHHFKVDLNNVWKGVLSVELRMLD